MIDNDLDIPLAKPISKEVTTEGHHTIADKATYTRTLPDGTVEYITPSKAVFRTKTELNCIETIDMVLKRGYIEDDDLNAIFGGRGSLGVKLDMDAVDFEANPELKLPCNIHTPRYQKLVELMKDRFKKQKAHMFHDIAYPNNKQIRKNMSKIDPTSLDIDMTNNLLLFRALYKEELAMGLPEYIERHNMISVPQHLRGNATAETPTQLRKVTIQPRHSSERLQELGFDPIRALVDKYHEMEFMLDIMRTGKKRSLMAEANILATLQKTSKDLLAYGYMTKIESERLAIEESKLPDTDLGKGGNIINITLAGISADAHADFIDEPLERSIGDSSDSYSVVEGNEHAQSDSSTKGKIDYPAYVSSPDVDSRLAGVDYRQRNLIESGLDPMQPRVEFTLPANFNKEPEAAPSDRTP